MNISALIREDKEFSAFSACLAEAHGSREHLPIVVNGLGSGAQDAFICEAVREARRLSDAPTLLLAGSEEQRARICALLSSAGLHAVEYKPRDLVFYNVSASHDVDRERLEVLFLILSGGCDAVVTTPAAASSLTMPRELLESLSLDIEMGTELSPDALCHSLSHIGFSPVESVEGVGQFSHRGGIVDFFGADATNPVRVEFFGDEVDRITYFDAFTQRSLENCDRVSLIPAREVILDSDAAARVKGEIARLLSSASISDEVRTRLTREQAMLDAIGDVGSRDRYINLIYENKTCLFDYFNGEKPPIILINGTNECKENIEAYAKKMESDRRGMISTGLASMRMGEYVGSLEDYEGRLRDALTVHINPFAGGVSSMRLSGLFGFRSRRTVSYGGHNNAAMLIDDLEAFRRGSYRVLILCESSQGADSLTSTLADADVSAALLPEVSAEQVASAPSGAVLVSVGQHEGFDLISARIAVLSMARDCGRAVVAHRRAQQRIKRAGGTVQKVMSHLDLSVGDYVVHASYGIGLFEGIQAVSVDGVTKDYITIKYAGTDKLFVPCDRLEMIGKYIGEKDKDGTVKLSHMGGKEWIKAKSRAKAAVKDIAKSLIALYAERQRTPGFAFARDTELEEEFDAEFSYEETESQLTAIAEIKADMMRPVPMNRLLCGDVGFGKTEVALRAAFKAILGGKQVALLVPTTILALQHYQTATSRMRGYAVNVEMLSRFKKPRERADIIERTKRGSVDLLIGTHAMLSKNVEFHDLGLLIIDEEQRFGVAQKESLRRIAKNVDTLMLSATPIPRTLNMSMSGINDISVLDEAPGERRPVQTYVMEHDEELIVDALRRELDRGGQSLYLYNKIEDISLVAGKIADALPEARVTYAHGRMDKEELEDIWQCLVRGEIDILVCTTIVETGVDLPNANTLVIENADRFGLSQLHQIRGRVGRSERQAYAYFTYRRGRSISETAEKRLEAIREFAEFGAGFKIALRDLEIRGAGNLLGAEQHGYIESVGYDLYIKLLNDAVLEERGEVPEERFESTIAIGVSAHIPEHYIKSSAARMDVYKRISFIDTPEDRDDIYDELTDRFGDVPRTVERLLDVALARSLAARARIKKIELTGGRLTFVMEKPDLYVWSELFESFSRLAFVGAGSPNVVYRLYSDEEPTRAAAKIMTEYARILSEKQKGEGI